jgi:NAD(P)-dependent dehydrogenase (short-subunit alcohol dehydrogenase family)
MLSRLPTAIVFGVGDGIGSAACTKFINSGYRVLGVRRSPDGLSELKERLGENFVAMDGVDARKEEDVMGVFEKAKEMDGPISCVVHNIGANIKFPIADTTARKFEKCWEMACFSGFLVGREGAKVMAAQGASDGPRTILFTGATASIRGSSSFAAFSVAKSGLRSLSQSMARELGPKQIHVAHVVVDGAVNTSWIRENFADMLAQAPVDAIVDPAEIAEAFWYLHNQKRCAWTHEMDIRPYCEKW